MANQYTGNFEHIVQSKFQCSAEALLLQAKQKRLSYRDVGELLGLKQVTVRKWATRFGIRLAQSVSQNTTAQTRDLFHAKQINQVNFLSRVWSPHV